MPFLRSPTPSGTFPQEGGIGLETDLTQWFTALYERNALNMVRYAAYQLRSPALAEELVSEAFVRLLQHQEELQTHPNPAGWLWKTLQHLILTEVKLAKYHREVPLEDAARFSSPETETEHLADALPEIALRLGISEVNSRTRLFRAKAHCKKLLEKDPSCVTNRPGQAITSLERRDGHVQTGP